eukprot:g1693.t1
MTDSVSSISVNKEREIMHVLTRGSRGDHGNNSAERGERDVGDDDPEATEEEMEQDPYRTDTEGSSEGDDDSETTDSDDSDGEEDSSEGDEDTSDEYDESSEEEGSEYPSRRSIPTDVNVNVDDIKMHLTCRICKGYFRDAHTIVECLHTFCKSCILLHFKRGGKSCPHCNRSLELNPETMVRFDRSIQCLVDKIFPELQSQDSEREGKFYASRGIKRKSIETSKPPLPSMPSRHETKAVDRSSKRSTHAPDSKQQEVDPSKSNNDPHGSKSADDARKEKPTTTQTDGNMDFKLVANADCAENLRLQQLPKPFLRTSQRLRVAHIRKYLGKKLSVANPGAIEVLCAGSVLGSKYTLAMISAEFWETSKGKLVLEYRMGA